MARLTILAMATLNLLHTQAALSAWLPEPGSAPWCVALSGGADSMALLVAMVQRLGPQSVVALHVNHGLQSAAGEFEAHCAQWCARLGVSLRTARVDAHAAPGESPEDAARRARYAALTELALGASKGSDNSFFKQNRQYVGVIRTSLAIKNIAIGQHADDQLETVLLALSRGAGVAGLAGMPSRFERDGVAFHRPWLQADGASIRLWLKAQGVSAVIDPSNADTQFTRNRIRHTLLPALLNAFPHARSTFARSAAHAAQAAELLDALADIDLALCGEPPQLAALQALSAARQANVLRRWLKRGHSTQASAAQLAELQRQITACTTRGHRIELKVGHGRAVRRGAHLVMVRR